MTRQVVQEVRGSTTVRTIPAPIAGPGQVVVANVASLISAGTERYVVELAKKSLIGKARERPDQVRRVLQKMKEEGVLTTLQQVRAKLDDAMPLGYSSAGVVLECGVGVHAFKPGDRVASTGPHAGVVAVGHNQCARLPDSASYEDAAYTAVGAIALEGVRLTNATLGERVLVIGLGLIGQITVQLLKAQGCRVFGTDVDPARLQQAKKLGADTVASGYPADEIRTFTGSMGVDAVLITAATDSNRPIEFAAEVARVKGRIVLVGVAGLTLPRPPFFAKELEFTVSSALGPGLNELYSERAHDYPFGRVRWTAQRNMQAVLDLIGDGRLNVRDLTTHRFPIERAVAAYELVSSRREPFTGILLQYGEPPVRPIRRLTLKTAAAPNPAQPGLSLIGAGNFARLILLPEIKRRSGATLRGICTARGMSAEVEGTRSNFAFATTDVEEVLGDPETRAIVVATRHDLHADLVVRGLRAGKHVFVEKPLTTTLADLDRIIECVQSLGDRCPVLTIGFNRRFAPAIHRLQAFFAGIRPLAISYRFAVPSLPPEHWVHDSNVGGGRLIGEACHAIDACAALAGSVPVRVFAESAAAVGEAQVANDRVFITLRLADGSVSSVAYQAGGDRGLPGERIEIFGGDRTAIVTGWDQLEMWQGGVRKRERGGLDKGHAAEVRAFLHVIRAGGQWPIPWEHLVASSEATLLAAESLRDGLPQTLGRDVTGYMPAAAE